MFNETEEINANVAAEIIDKHSRGGIRKGEAKWYSPTYSLSEKEALIIASKCLDYGTIKSRKIVNFNQLSKNEQDKYNKEIRSLAVLFQNQMAKNFNKEDLGINNNKDLIWFGAIEHSRKYKGYDREVKNKNNYQGQDKPGFNTHIHIVQSRKANNLKKSLISPMANARKKTKQNAGFDRNLFYNKIEQTFDDYSGMNRIKEETFEHYKSVKKKNKSTDSKSNYIPKEEVDIIIENSNCIDYFLELESRGIFNKIRENKNSFVFKDKYNNENYIVTKKGYFNTTNNTSGGIINAMKIFDNFSWTQSLKYINTLNKYYTENSNNTLKVSNKNPINIKVHYTEIKKIKFLNYIYNRGINNNDTIKKYFFEVYVNNKSHLGYKNINDDFQLINSNLKYINSSDISLYGNTKSKTAYVYNSIFDYLKEPNIDKINDNLIIIINEKTNLKSAFKILKKNSIEKIINNTNHNINTINKINKWKQ